MLTLHVDGTYKEEELTPFYLTIDSWLAGTFISSFVFKRFLLFNEHHGFLPILLTATKSSITSESVYRLVLFVSLPIHLAFIDHDLSLFLKSQALL
jgi:hypothetical protein